MLLLLPPLPLPLLLPLLLPRGRSDASQAVPSMAASMRRDLRTRESCIEAAISARRRRLYAEHGRAGCLEGLAGATES